jgi:hypothetical protein
MTVDDAVERLSRELTDDQIRAALPTLPMLERAAAERLLGVTGHAGFKLDHADLGILLALNTYGLRKRIADYLVSVEQDQRGQ